MPDLDPAFAHTETTASAETPAGDEASQTRATTVQKVETPPPTRSWELQGWLAIAFVVGGFVFMGVMGHLGQLDPVVRDAIIFIWFAIAAFFYGSSIGSTRKTEGQMKFTNDLVNRLTNGVAH